MIDNNLGCSVLLLYGVNTQSTIKFGSLFCNNTTPLYTG